MCTAGPAPTSFLAGSQYVAQLRGAARHGAALATIFEHSSAHESCRTARIDPNSILAACRDTADAARPIKSIRTRGYRGCGRADLINIVNTDAQLNARRGACVTPHCCATYCEPGLTPPLQNSRGVAWSMRGTYPRFRALRRTLVCMGVCVCVCVCACVCVCVCVHMVHVNTSCAYVLHKYVVTFQTFYSPNG